MFGLEQLHWRSNMWPCKLKLDEKKSKHASLANSFDTTWKEGQCHEPAGEECNKYDLTTAPCLWLPNHYDFILQGYVPLGKWALGNLSFLGQMDPSSGVTMVPQEKWEPSSLRNHGSLRQSDTFNPYYAKKIKMKNHSKCNFSSIICKHFFNFSFILYNIYNKKNFLLWNVA
jgi:hypothetical protein